MNVGQQLEQGMTKEAGKLSIIDDVLRAIRGGGSGLGLGNYKNLTKAKRALGAFKGPVGNTAWTRGGAGNQFGLLRSLSEAASKARGTAALQAGAGLGAAGLFGAGKSIVDSNRKSTQANQVSQYFAQQVLDMQRSMQPRTDLNIFQKIFEPWNRGGRV